MNTINIASAIIRAGLLSAAVAMAMLPQRVSAQAMDHSKMNMPMPPEKKAPEKKPVPKKKTSKPAAPAMAPGMDHSKMHMPMPAAKPAPVKKPVRKKAATKPKPVPTMDHSAMGHDMPMPATTAPAERMPQPKMDHSKMGHDKDDMPGIESMDHSTMPGMSMAPTEPLTPIPVLTDADRAAAVPPTHDHPAHDNSIQSYTLIDRIEAWNADNGTGLEWEGHAWIGTDLNRVWLRSQGERIDGRTDSADLEVLYGRSVAAWWDVVAGVRHDFKPGGSQDFAAIGVMGVVPSKYEIEATAYIGQSGQTSARLQAEYDTLLTGRLILQSLVEVNLYGQDDPQRGIGSGLSTLETGYRLRYEFTRQFAPYIGIVRERAFGGTADLRRDGGEDIDDTRFVAGLRIWF